jgi:hypothetical protein
MFVWFETTVVLFITGLLTEKQDHAGKLHEPLLSYWTLVIINSLYALSSADTLTIVPCCKLRWRRLLILLQERHKLKDVRHWSMPVCCKRGGIYFRLTFLLFVIKLVLFVTWARIQELECGRLWDYIKSSQCYISMDNNISYLEMGHLRYIRQTTDNKIVLLMYGVCFKSLRISIRLNFELNSTAPTIYICQKTFTKLWRLMLLVRCGCERIAVWCY